MALWQMILKEAGARFTNAAGSIDAGKNNLYSGAHKDTYGQKAMKMLNGGGLGGMLGGDKDEKAVKGTDAQDVQDTAETASNLSETASNLSDSGASDVISLAKDNGADGITDAIGALK